jgi:hypothetical protein
VEVDFNPTFRIDRFDTALPSESPSPVQGAPGFQMINHGDNRSWDLGRPIEAQCSQLFNCGPDRNWDFVIGTGPTQPRNQILGGRTLAFERRIWDQIEIADSSSLALPSMYAPRGDGTSVDDYWPGSWPQIFPTGLSPGPISVLEPPSFLSPIESLAQIDFSNVENQTGKNLVRLFDARATLDAVGAAVGSCLDSWEMPSALRIEDGALSGFELSTEAALGYFDIREPASSHFWDNAVLCYVVLAEQIHEALVRIQEKTLSLLVRISYQIRSLGKVFFCAIRRYCAFGWARRAWFLLHGSHPPRAERWQTTSQAFGCARALAF